MAFTSNTRDVDLAFLLETPDRDLPQLCRSNRYVEQLCSSDRHWQLRIEQRFGRRWDEVPSVTPKEYYHFLAYRDTPEIAAVLGLTPEENVIRVKTRDGDVMIGSEKYLSLAVLIPRAIRKGRPDLAGYFADIYRKLIEKYPGPLARPHLDESIATAIDHNEMSLAVELIALHKGRRASTPQAQRALGRHNMPELLPEIGAGPTTAFVNGLIEGGHYDTFVDIVRDAPITDPGPYPALGNPATDPRFLEFVLETASNKKDIYKQVGRNAFRNGFIDFGAQFEQYMDPSKIYKYLYKVDPVLAEEYRDGRDFAIKGKVLPQLRKPSKETDDYIVSGGRVPLLWSIQYRDLFAYYIAKRANLKLESARLSMTEKYIEWKHFVDTIREIGLDKVTSDDISHALELF